MPTKKLNQPQNTPQVRAQNHSLHPLAPMPDFPDYIEDKLQSMCDQTGQMQAPGHTFPQTHGYYSDVPAQASAHAAPQSHGYQPAGQPQARNQAAQPTHGYYPAGQPHASAHAAPQIHEHHAAVPTSLRLLLQGHRFSNMDNHRFPDLDSHLHGHPHRQPPNLVTIAHR
jgi:hypothetical protein